MRDQYCTLCGQPVRHLSPREREVRDLLREGYTVKDIAALVYRSEKTMSSSR